MTKRRATVVAFLVFGGPALIGGCSFVAVQNPRKDERGRLEPAGCTTRMVAPAADGIITGALLVGTVMAAGSGEQSSNPSVRMTNDDQIMVGAVFAALFGISALYGVVGVGNCREANGMRTAPNTTNDQRRNERRAEDAAEESAVQARSRAQAAADAQAAAAAYAAINGRAPTDAGTNADAGAPPAVAPNQRRDDGR